VRTVLAAVEPAVAEVADGLACGAAPAAALAVASPTGAGEPCGPSTGTLVVGVLVVGVLVVGTLVVCTCGSCGTSTAGIDDPSTFATAGGDASTGTSELA